MLDRLVLQRLEIGAEVAIFQVDDGRSDQIITEKQIVVPELDL